MRQRKDFQRIEGVKSSRLIVIAAEGRATENIYFEAMRQELCATNVQLVVLNREDDNSNPANVHRQIKDFMDEYNILDVTNCGLLSIVTTGRKRCLPTLHSYVSKTAISDFA